MLYHFRAAYGLLALALACAPIAAEAQTKKITAPSSTIPIQGIAFGGMGEPARPVTDDDGLPVRIISGGGGGGGGGGDASAAKQDVGNAALGAPGAGAWSGAGDGSLISISKSIRGLLAGGLAVTGAFYPAVQPSSMADGSDVATGSTGATACATDNGACALTALAKRTNQRITSLITAVGTPLQAGGSVVVSTLPVTSPTLAAQNAGNASLASILIALGDNATGADIEVIRAKLDEILTNPDAAPIKPVGVVTTDASGAVTSAGAFQTALAASSTRLGCLIQNPIAANETLFVYPGASGQTTAKSVNLAPGASFNCNAFGVVLTDAIQVTAATAGHSFVVKSQ